MNKQKVYAWHLLGDGKLAHPHVDLVRLESPRTGWRKANMFETGAAWAKAREVELGETLYVTGTLLPCQWAMHGMRYSDRWIVSCRDFLRVCRVELTDATLHGWKYMARSRKIVAYKDFPNGIPGSRAFSRTASVRVRDINAKTGWVILEGWKVR